MKYFVYFPEQQQKASEDGLSTMLNNTPEGWYEVAYTMLDNSPGGTQRATIDAEAVNNIADYGHLDTKPNTNSFYCYTQQKTIPRFCCCLRAKEGAGLITIDAAIDDDITVLINDEGTTGKVDATPTPSVQTVKEAITGAFQSEVGTTTGITIDHVPVAQTGVTPGASS